MHPRHAHRIIRFGRTKKHSSQSGTALDPLEFGPAHLSYRPKPLFAYALARYSSPYRPGLRTR
jgi:hypothetical protein